MNVRFKNNANTYECTEPVEQKVFRSGTAIGWAIMFHIHGDVNSSEIDKLLTTENISELVFTNDDEQKTAFAVTGYSAVTACTIRHKATATVTELQFTKTNKTESESETTTEE